jgi:hypothetical protein
LAPFDVKVVIIVTGGVKSNIARVDRTLPENSIYVPISPEYERRTKHSQEVGMPNEKYASSVVSQVLAGRKTRNIWEGSSSWLVWFVSTFLPTWIMVSTAQLTKLAIVTNVFKGLCLYAHVQSMETEGYYGCEEIGMKLDL